LAAIPPPPRSVIIERLPPLPPKPRDIIIERWVPYGAMAKRKVIVQRAAAAQAYARPRNVIIVYEAVHARVIRQFQRLGVTPENPQAYVARYGAQLIDSQTLVQQARAAGVVEDISAPAGSLSVSSQFASAYGQESSSGGLVGAELATAGAAGGAGFTSSGYESSSFSQQGGAAGLGDLSVIGGAESGTYGLNVASGGGYSSSYTGGQDSALAGGAGISAGYESSSFGSSSAGGFDAVAAGFNTADVNKDGRLDQNEFRQFYAGGV